MKKLRAVGHIGSWYADVKDGEKVIDTLPVCLDIYARPHWPHYKDPWGLAKYPDFANVLRGKGKAILAQGLWEEGASAAKRGAYIAIVRVENIKASQEDGLEFDIVSRENDLE